MSDPSASSLSATLFFPEEIDVLGRRAPGLAGRFSTISYPLETADGQAEKKGESKLEDPASPSLQARMEMWMAESADSRADLFSKRLEWDGIRQDAAALLKDEWPLPAGERPKWLSFLEHLSPGRQDSPWAALATEVAASSPAPFASACRPFLIAALDIFQLEGPASLDSGVDESIIRAAVRGLLQELSSFTAPVLARRFKDYLSQRQALPDASSSRNYHAFSDDLGLGRGWAPVLLEYAGLARLMAVVCLGWARETQEFITRFQTDRGELEQVFQLSGPENCTGLKLKAVQVGISDRHGGAGTVKVLEFSDGRKLVYKRRPLDLEADFHQLLRALREQGLDCAPPALAVLPKAGYGWVEHASAGPVDTAGELEMWFKKAGSLLCLMHLLGGNDGHMENVIATTDGPVLIDLETLLQPTFASRDNSAGRNGSSPAPSPGTFTEAARRVQDSVLQTGLLPLWQRGRQGALYDIGGLTGEGGYESPAPRLVWENTSTDGICPAWRRGIALGLKNLPVFEGARHSAVRNLPALCAGFSTTWRALQSHAGAVHAALDRWSEAPIRVLLRPTTHYASLLERSLAAGSLKHGIDRSLIFEALRRQFVRAHPSRPLLWAAVEHETQALENGDIPVFYVRAGGHHLEDAHGECLIENAFSRSPLEASMAKLGALTEAGLQRQLEMIATAFIRPDDRAAPEAPQAESSDTVDYAALLKTVPLISDDGLIRAATMLGGQIINAAIRGKDGFVTWLAPAFLHPDKKEQRGVSYYLYDGAAGMSLFLAALARVTGLDAAKRTALAALEPVRAILDSPHAGAMVSREGIGGCSGLASLVYALTGVSRLLDAPELLERAARISLLIDDARIARDQSLDIVSGSAGAILSLLALHRATGDSEVLARAVACGEHLLAQAERVGDDALAWNSWPDRVLLAGYSHGTAGGAAALLALFKATGTQAYADAARAALRHERGLYDPKAENWPLLLPGGGSRFVSTWCHGAPGILLSRMGFLGVFGEHEDSLLRAEMEAACRTTLAAGLSGVDHLCCGTMGRVEILHVTADAMPGSSNLSLARLGATLTVRRAQQRKAFTLQTDPVRNAVFQPGFFRGSSGIGHTLLRLARPDLVPSVLNWDI
ncbi:MAG: Lanthionine synthetase family protein [Verrucomicrobiales bacterium]|nr:Lanthionine synthetase family protein [Verrucomicrobiales bacterium]